MDQKAERISSRIRSERGSLRHEAILNAAMKEFSEKGYHAASLRNITRMAGGSAETLYQQFGNKAGLFAAVISRSRERTLEFASLDSGRPVADELLDIARRYLTTVMTPESLALHRVIIGESARNPEAARQHWGLGTGKFAALLARYLAQRAAEGALDIPDPELAALQFLEMVKAGLQIRVLYGEAECTPEQIEVQASSAVRVFLNGAACRSVQAAGTRRD